MKILSMALMMAALAPVAGCSSILTSDAPRETIYALQPAPAREAATAGTARIVEIGKPSVPPGFDTSRIALFLDGGRTLDYYASAKWPDSLDDVLQEFTRRTASATLPFVVAADPDQLSGADFRLDMRVNEFQPVYAGSAGGTPRLVADIDFTLVKMPEQKIVRSFRLTRRGEAAGGSLTAVAAGLEAMLRDMEAEAFGRMEPQLRGRNG